MKKIIKDFLVPLILIFICMLDPAISNAQIISDPGCDPLDPACPIDGGVYLLVAAAIAIAAVKAYKKQQASL